MRGISQWVYPKKKMGRITSKVYACALLILDVFQCVNFLGTKYHEQVQTLNTDASMVTFDLLLSC